MIIKPGVSLLGMRPEIMPAMMVVNEVYALHGHNLVLTSVTDGKHGANSYHYDGLAFDARTNYFKTADQVHCVAEDIRQRLGFPFDVVVEKDHIHIEFDLRKALSKKDPNL